MKSFFKIDGLDQLKKSIKELGKIPQKHVAASAKKGMNIVKKAAKAAAPEDEGYLKKAIILNGERSRLRGKKVFAVIFDPEYNDIFQGKSVHATKKVFHKQGGRKWYSNELKEYYYPASQEYGYFLRNGKYQPGLKFMHNALQKNTKTVSKVMVESMQNKLEAEIRKGRLK